MPRRDVVFGMLYLILYCFKYLAFKSCKIINKIMFQNVENIRVNRSDRILCPGERMHLCSACFHTSCSFLHKNEHQTQ